MGKEFRILALDGGGLLGIYTAAVLARLEQHYGKNAADHFDLIASTSAGAITGAALTLGISGVELVQFFREKGSKIFHHNVEGTPLDFFRKIKQLLFTSKHSNAELLNAYREIYGEKTLADAGNYLCISSFNVTKGATRVFKTPHHRNLAENRGIKLWQAVACSSAAPTFLPEYFPGFAGEENCGYVDGGSWANNPAMMGLTEAYKYFVGKKKKFKNVKIVSIASFAEELKRKKKLMSVRDWSFGMDFMGLFMTAQSASVDYMMGNMLKDIKRGYLRIEPVVTEEMAKIFTADNTSPEVLDKMVEAGNNSAAQALLRGESKKMLDDIFKTKKATNPGF